MSRRFVPAAVALFLVPALALAFSSGPPPGKVKLCMTQPGACSQCHASAGDPPSANLELWIDGAQVLPSPPAPAPAAYVPDRTYAMLIKVVETAAASRCTHPPTFLGCGNPVPQDSCAFGFEFTAVRAATCFGSPVQAGCLVPAGVPPTTQIVCSNPAGAPVACPATPCTDPAVIEYVEHVCETTVDPGSPSSNQWTFDYTAPPAGTGAVAFYFAVNSTNASGSSTGDHPYFSADDPALTLVWPEGGGPTGCDLRRESVASLTPPIDKCGALFPDNSCVTPPASCPLGGGGESRTVHVANFTATPDQDVDPFAGGDPLVVYQVVSSTCATCASGPLKYLRLMKRGTQIRATYQ